MLLLSGFIYTGAQENRNSPSDSQESTGVTSAAGSAKIVSSLLESADSSRLGRPDETDILLNQDGESVIVEKQSFSGEFPSLSFGDVIRFILVIGVFIVLIYLFLMFLRKISGARATGGDLITLLSVQPLKGDSILYVIKAGARFFLISSSSSSVNLITEFDDEDSKNHIQMNDDNDRRKISGGFTNFLMNRFKRFHDMLNKQHDFKQSDPVPYFQKQRERLKKL